MYMVIAEYTPGNLAWYGPYSYDDATAMAEKLNGKIVIWEAKSNTMLTKLDTDNAYVSVEDVLETIRDMAHHPDHVFVTRDLLEELERRLMYQVHNAKLGCVCVSLH